MGHKLSIHRVKAIATVPSTVPCLDAVVLSCRRNSCWKRRRIIASFTFRRNSWQPLGEGVVQNASEQDAAVPLAKLEGKEPRTLVKVVCLAGSNVVLKARLTLGELLADLRETSAGKTSSLHLTVAPAAQDGLMLCLNGRICAVGTCARGPGNPAMKGDEKGSTKSQEMAIDGTDKAEDDVEGAEECQEKALHVPDELPAADEDEKEASDMAEEEKGAEDILFMPSVIRYDLSPSDTLAGYRQSFMVNFANKALGNVRSIPLAGLGRPFAALSSARLWVTLVTQAGWAFTALICFISWLEHSGQ